VSGNGELNDRRRIVPSWIYLSSGFSSFDGMRQAHLPLIRTATSFLASMRHPRVLDLGCGSGYFLRCLRQQFDAEVYGIDVDPLRVHRARQLLLLGEDRLWPCDMFSLPLTARYVRFDLIYFMPGRLLEVTGSRRALLLQWIELHADRVALYCYGDWSSRFGGVRGICAELGIRVIDRDGHLDCVLVRGGLLSGRAGSEGGPDRVHG
jgi:SAM-dependent methyltransferase